MKLTCYIVDDQRYCIDFITYIIEETDSFKIIGSATDPRKAIEEIIELNQT